MDETHERAIICVEWYDVMSYFKYRYAYTHVAYDVDNSFKDVHTCNTCTLAHLHICALLININFKIGSSETKDCHFKFLPFVADLLTYKVLVGGYVFKISDTDICTLVTEIYYSCINHSTELRIIIVKVVILEQVWCDKETEKIQGNRDKRHLEHRNLKDNREQDKIKLMHIYLSKPHDYDDGIDDDDDDDDINVFQVD
ncbi:hypothetical protein PHYBLDRAFT_173136 [Phycomyces blakesleeanus NRRL 1555(-)]|uniref:Uncharacterized protein n=1 Tax=Phycomyces blakesleeanus (strain ATCC 8743b / DSM 1359 / FGSC 10004 / NBRC 33097 / NRRL 1555) TaxID=763407 RepID=A0A167KRL4_PHYB8|nr:hypothetical protein PHYBLDRAFT_173136 [Phycomyces blakesleeanus NRRL 1555(-)]OAD68718.1 hypothetical protein PHYBLDRAFT_173136 [Phycomyces blakesleeanus NRRL 1555(-)]|eukprot:XP_018286758.1 hypothetical protein PHYBLDRAFT_173136 [Phycomyces blakesleeanus NRRL 1555(-)]